MLKLSSPPFQFHLIMTSYTIYIWCFIYIYIYKVYTNVQCMYSILFCSGWREKLFPHTAVCIVYDLGGTDLTISGPYVALTLLMWWANDRSACTPLETTVLHQRGRNDDSESSVRALIMSATSNVWPPHPYSPALKLELSIGCVHIQYTHTCVMLSCGFTFILSGKGHCHHNDNNQVFFSKLL